MGIRKQDMSGTYLEYQGSVQYYQKGHFGFSKRQENLKTPIFDPILRVLQKK